MSRKVILTLAAAATVAAAGLSTSTAYARSFGGGGSGHSGRVTTFARISHTGHTLHPILPGRGHPIRPGHPIRIGGHDHGHWMFRGGRWVEIDQVVEETIAGTPTPGPCTCLTKTYTPTGLVVFSDLCTKESASAPVDGSPAKASQVPTSSDFAGRTYEDYLAANPQSPQAPQKN